MRSLLSCLATCATCAALGVVATATACSGTSGEGSVPDDPQASLPGSSGAAPGAGSSGASGGPAGSPDSGTADGSAGDGGGGGGGDGGGGGGGGGSLCIAGSIAEAENNDTADKANALPGASSTYCGKLSSAADVDYAAFTLPADASSIAFGSDFTKVGVEFDVTVGGETFTVGGTTLFKPGQRYVVKAYTTGSGPVDYRLSVAIKK